MTTTQITPAQVKAVSKFLAGRQCRPTACRGAIEVRGTSRLEVIDLMVEDLRVRSKQLGILLIYVDPAIYDATAR